MIVTHAQNASGQRRVYLGGKSSIECWIEPAADGRSWTFHLDTAATGISLDSDDRREWAVHTLLRLAEALNIAPDCLQQVPFEMIAALHTSDPFAARRIPSPRRQQPAHAFLTTPPDIRRPQAEFNTRTRSSSYRPGK